MKQLNRYERQKYAKAMRRVEFGVWGFNLSLFRSVTLTTVQGDDMSTKKFKFDLQHLIQSFRRDGYHVEYCGCFEYTATNNILHWHGILRIKGGYFPVDKDELSKRWQVFHGASQVDISVVRSMKVMVEYLNKHMVKDYLDSQAYIRNKFLVSRGWKREGIDDIIEEFKFWWVNGCEHGSWMGTKGYEVMNALLKRWCEKRNVLVKADFGWFKVNEKNVNYDIYGREVK